MSKILTEFQEQFSDKEALQEYLNNPDNTTDEDRFRMEGKLYYKEGLQTSDEVSPGEIAMSASLRRAFAGGLKLGEVVYVYNQDNPSAKVALTVKPALTKNREEENKVGYRQPAINTEDINNIANGNRKIIIEKKVK